MRIVNEVAERELVSEGSHNAICTSIVDLGTQVSSNPQYPERRQLSFTFEIQDEQTSEDAPFYVYKTFSAGLAPKSNLAKTLKTWRNITIDRNESFDTDDLLGQPAMVTIEHRETDKGTFANVTAISAPLKGTKFKQPSADLISFSLDTDKLDTVNFDLLSEWIQNKIAESPEYDELTKKKVSAPVKKVVAKKAAKKTAKK